jgi:hypothetical protein
MFVEEANASTAGGDSGRQGVRPEHDHAIGMFVEEADASIAGGDPRAWCS